MYEILKYVFIGAAIVLIIIGLATKGAKSKKKDNGKKDDDKKE